MSKASRDKYRNLILKFGSYRALKVYIMQERFDLAITLLKHENGAHVNVNSDLSFSETPLHMIAAKSPSAETIEVCKLLLVRGAKVHAVDQFGWTPLHYAARWRDNYICEILVFRFANINAASKTGVTPLHIAAEAGNKDTVRLLLRRGVTVNAVNSCGERPLHVLAKKHGLAFLCQALGVSSSLDQSVSGPHSYPQLYWDAEAYSEVIEMLLEGGAELDARNELGETPLHVAVASCYEFMVRLLVRRGCDVNAKTNENLSALHFAVRVGQLQLVNFLLNNGADLNADFSETDFSILDVALDGRNEEIATLLLQQQLMANTPIKDNVDLFHRAIRMGCEGFVKEMLENCSDISSFISSSSEGRSSLHVAAECGHLGIVLLLLSSDADVNIQDASGNTPLYYASSVEVSSALLDRQATGRICPSLLPYAVKSNRTDLIKRVLDDGADLHARDENGMTALHIAALSRAERLIPLLVDRGVDLDLRDWRKGFSALHFAASKTTNSRNIMSLVKCGADINSSEPLIEEHRRSTRSWMYEGTDCGAELRIHSEPSTSSVVDGPVRTFSGRTPLVVAIEIGCAHNVNVLLKYGADINIKYHGRTPLQIAKKKARPEPLRLLLFHIVRLKTAGMLITESDLLTENFYLVQDFLLELETELYQMKKMRIGKSNAYFYDFLIKSSKESAILFRKENIRKTLKKTPNYQDRFKEYSYIVKYHVDLAEKWWCLFDEFASEMRTKLSPALPDLCLDKITDYLSHKDLQSMIRAFRSAPKWKF